MVMIDSEVRRPAGPRIPRARLWAMALSVLFNGVAPIVVYAVLRSHVGSDATALAIGTAVPIVVTATGFAIRRRLEPIGTVAVVVFGIALIITALSGGNVLVLKLQDAIVTGPLGLACLVSVAVKRPLHLVVMRLAARRNPALQRVVDGPAARRNSTVMTALLGTMLLLHALVLLALALTESTSTFLSVSRPAGWAITGAGVVALLWYRRRLRNRVGG
jgi:FtsH-binding integral membrane protein